MARRTVCNRIIRCAVVVYLLAGCAGTGPAGPAGSDPVENPPAFTDVSPSATRVEITAGESTPFEVRAESPAGLPVTVTWTVDGDPRASGVRFVFEPAAAGTFTVEAVASDGVRATRREWTVEVASPGPAPNVAPTAVLAIDPRSGTAPLSVRVRLTGDDSDGAVVDYRIRITGDLDLTIDRSAPIDTTLVLESGDYTVTGRVKDDAGETTRSTATVTVAPPPNQSPVPALDVDPVAGMAPLDVVIRGGGSDADGRIVRYALDVDGDGSFDAEADTPLLQSIRYSAAGQYRVVLEVTDDRGAVARDSALVRVSAANPPPTSPPPANQAPTATLQVSPTSGEAPLTVHGTVTGSDPDGSVTSVSIDFDGDGTPELQATSGSVEGDFTFDAEGTWTVRATVLDDAGATASATATVTVTAPPGGGGGGSGGGTPPPANTPPTGSLTADRTSGDATLTVTFTASGSDPDGSVAGLELDPDDGSGFVLVTGGTLQVGYAYRAAAYRPRLRITDDAGATTVVDGPAITVLRPVDGARSTVSASGNARFDGVSIAPAIWADGQDRVRFSVVVNDHSGQPLAGVPVRVTSLRPDLVAPDGTKIGNLVPIALDASTTDGSGRVTGSATTRTSTRVERVPTVGSFTRFDLKVEADAGSGTWRRLPDVSGLNAETIVDGNYGVGQFYVKPAGLTCVGQPIEIHVRALRRADAPGAGGPADGLYTEIRYAFDGSLLAVSPKSGYGGWRTDSNGWIVFTYTPPGPDSKAIRAWVDGQPINITAAIAAVDCP